MLHFYQIWKTFCTFNEICNSRVNIYRCTIKKRSAACAEGILNPPPHALAWSGRAESSPRTLQELPPISPICRPHAADPNPRRPSSPLGAPLVPLFAPPDLTFGFPLGVLLPPLGILLHQVLQDRPPSAPSAPQVTTMTPHDLNMCPK